MRMRIVRAPCPSLGDVTSKSALKTYCVLTQRLVTFQEIDFVTRQIIFPDIFRINRQSGRKTKMKPVLQSVATKNISKQAERIGISLEESARKRRVSC